MTHVIWEGDNYDVIVESTLVINKITYWNIKIKNESFWVIKRFIPDLQPLVTYWIKIIFNLNMLPVIRTTIKGRMYLLYKVSNPNDQHLLTALSNEEKTDSVIKQAKEIYAFRRIMLLHCKYDGDIIYRTENMDRVLYSLVEIPTNKPIINHSIFRRWFGDKPIENYIKKRIEKMAPCLPSAEISRLAHGIDHFDKNLRKVAEINDIQLLSYTNDVINQLITMTL